tara:strand:- start:174 stop:974 length:801 start_codon:yes stop_codon:yes gene_type:complete
MGQSISSYFDYNFNITCTQRELFDYMSDYNNLEQVEHFKNKYKDKIPFYSYMQPELPSKKSCNCSFYELFIYIEPDVSEIVRQSYLDNAAKHNALVESYIYGFSDPSANEFTFNAGFDLLCPNKINVTDNDETIMLDHKIKTCMKRNNNYVGFYLYMRSSTASKTPLRLANNVGIIDSGYRGNIKALFDIKSFKNTNKNKLIDLTPVSSNIMEFDLNENDRFVQICPPILDYPMKIIIVDNINNLGNKTSRGEGAFGSTGNNGNLI